MKIAIRTILFVIIFLLGAAGFFYRWEYTFTPMGIVFSDPDCYSRMTRVEQIYNGFPRGEVSGKHFFENAPHYVVPHTTLAMDLPIVALAKSFVICGIKNPLDMAGAWISPILGLFYLVITGVWSWRKKFGLAAFVLFALSPIVAHAFEIGRPDHQSLILLLCSIGLMCEFRYWKKQTARSGKTDFLFSLVWMFSWMLALWVSMFEPIILLCLCLLLRLFIRGRAALPKNTNDYIIVVLTFVLFLPIFANAILRLTLHPLPPETIHYFSAWAKGIGEMQPASWDTIFAWLGWLVPFFPLLLLWKAWRKRELFSLALVILFVVVAGLTLGTVRWAYFLPLIAALTAPTAFTALPLRKTLYALLAISLWPVAACWENNLFDEGICMRAREKTIEANSLRTLGNQILEANPPAPESQKSYANYWMSRPVFLAPWWDSPQLAYWSQARGLAGSSHQSLPGIVETAKFFLSTDDAEALEILHDRQVDFIVVDDPERILQNARTLFSQEPPSDTSKKTMAERLFRKTDIPAQLEHIADVPHFTPFFRLYRIKKPQ